MGYSPERHKELDTTEVTEHAGIYLSHFVYLIIFDGHLGRFHLLASVNNAAVNGGCADMF